MDVDEHARGGRRQDQWLHDLAGVHERGGECADRHLMGADDAVATAVRAGVEIADQPIRRGGAWLARDGAGHALQARRRRRQARWFAGREVDAEARDKWKRVDGGQKCVQLRIAGETGDF